MCSNCHNGFCELDSGYPEYSRTVVVRCDGHNQDCPGYDHIDHSFFTEDDIHLMPGPSNLRKLETKKPLMGPDWKPAPGFERLQE